MAQTAESFIRKSGLTAGLFNLVLNPLFAWLSNMDMAAVPPGPAAVDTVITCLIMSLLVALFISADTRRAFKAGNLETSEKPSGRLLCRLPGRPWKLGLLFGFAFAAVAVPCLAGMYALSGVDSLTFFAFAALKAVYTPLIAYAVARWVILRQLAALAAALPG